MDEILDLLSQVFPRLGSRKKIIDRIKDPEREGRLFGKMMYAGDTCTAETEEALENSKNQLFAEWLRFWPEPNSTFLVQKTPFLDVQVRLGPSLGRRF